MLNEKSMTKDFLDAVKAGELSKVEAMIKASPSLINAKDERGLSAIILAKYYGQNETANFLASKTPEVEIFEAAALGDAEVTREAIAKLRDHVKFYSPNGFTALHLAVFFGHPEVARLLVEGGADVNAEAKNPMHVRPLHSAVAGHGKVKETVKLLLDYGASVNVKQQGGFTPLHEAAQSGYADVAELLLANGADVNARTDDDKTPLAMTRVEGREAGSKEDRERTAQVLLRHGAK